MKNNRAGEKNRRAFTLTEIAIVLGIIGVMLSGIWTASNTVRINYRANTILQQFSTFRQNAVTLFSSVTPPPVGSPANAAYNMTDQSCPAGPQCLSTLLITSGVFPPGFIGPTMTVLPAPYGQTDYQTSMGYGIWTGLYDCGLYAGGGPTVPGECSGQTVLELDMFGLDSKTCAHILMQAVNVHMTGLINIEAPGNGWGSVTGVVMNGNANFPTTLSVESATAACAAPGNSSYLWFIYSIS